MFVAFSARNGDYLPPAAAVAASAAAKCFPLISFTRWELDFKDGMEHPAIINNRFMLFTQRERKAIQFVDEK